MTREATADGRDPRIAGIVLAAGRSSRMAPLNKLLLDAGGEPVVRRVAAAALAAQLAPVVVVTGHAREAVTRALRGMQVEFAHNAESAEGIASSLRAGVRALPLDVDAAVVLLGDMPLVEARHLRALLAAFAPERGGSLCDALHVQVFLAWLTSSPSYCTTDRARRAPRWRSIKP